MLAVFAAFVVGGFQFQVYYYILLFTCPLSGGNTIYLLNASKNAYKT